jgi:hypothetical protein
VTGGGRDGNRALTAAQQQEISASRFNAARLDFGCELTNR